MAEKIDDWLEAQRINGGPHGFECIGIARMQQVWEAAQKELRQQLADSQKQSIEDSENILRLIETIKYLQGIAVRGSGIDQSDDQTVEQFVLSYVKGLEQQLAAALAACKQKDEALEAAHNGLRWWMDAFPLHVTEADNEEMLKLVKALTIQPDDSALKAWLGEPAGEVKKHTGSLKDMAIIVWSGEQPAEGTKLYSPKGLK